jgi:hypothetical protein
MSIVNGGTAQNCRTNEVDPSVAVITKGTSSSEDHTGALPVIDFGQSAGDLDRVANARDARDNSVQIERGGSEIRIVLASGIVRAGAPRGGEVSARDEADPAKRAASGVDARADRQCARRSGHDRRTSAR